MQRWDMSCTRSRHRLQRGGPPSSDLSRARFRRSSQFAGASQTRGEDGPELSCESDREREPSTEGSGAAPRPKPSTES